MTDGKAVRARWFDETRRLHNVEQSRRSPADRMHAAEALRAFAVEARKQRGHEAAGGDETPELWLRMRARFRSSD